LPDVIHFLRTARGAGIRNRALATRGYKCDKETFVDLKENGLTDVVVSLDSSDATQDVISRLPGAFSKAMSAIEAATQVDGLRVAINFTFFGPNFEHIERVAKIAHKFGIRMKVTPFVPRENLPRLTVAQVKAMEEHMALLSDAGYCARSLISKEDALPYSTPMICEAGISRVHIESDGSLSGCQFIAHHPEAVVGNIKEGFLRLWLDGDWSFYRKAAPLNAMCARCRDRKYCVRSCLALGDAMFSDAKMLNNHRCDRYSAG